MPDPQPSSRRFIVVPESLAADADGRVRGEPSFAYRAVLDFVAVEAGSNDQVFLAPANAFGGDLTEERAAWRYLRRSFLRFALYCPGENLPPVASRPGYVDTWGNATLLRPLLPAPECPCELVCARVHAARAQWCFARAGYRVMRVHGVAYRDADGWVPRRNFYYRHPMIHQLYEWAALGRDQVRHGWGPAVR